MEDSCKDCAYTTCARLHSYAAKDCKHSDGKPCQECVQMANLDLQISQVHSQLVQLSHKRLALNTKINQRHEPLIHRLPWSVSSQIFEDFVHQVHSDFDPKEASDSRHTRDWSPALFLSSICTTWRKIAFAASEIWRFINIPLLEDDPDVDFKIKLLDECVERSCQRTLFIGVFQFQLYENPRFSELKRKLHILEPLLDVIKTIACRSEEIRLWGVPLFAQNLIIPTNAPNLMTVRITDFIGGFLGDEDHYYGPSNEFSLAGPLLKNLEFGYGNSLLTFCQINWDTITTVTISAIHVEAAIDILRQAPCLTSCSFIFEDIFKTDLDPLDTPIVNLTLEKLHIDFFHCGLGFVKKFANSVTLPSLRELSLRTSKLLHTIPLFERSQCQLQTLTLSLYLSIPEDDVLALLGILPSVEHFALVTSIVNAAKPIITSKFFKGLCDHRFKPSSASTKPLLPMLTSLSYTGKKDFTWPAFLKIFPPPGDVLETGRPLSEVSLKLKLPNAVIGDINVIAKLREIQQSKIKLVVTNLDGEDLL